MSRRKRLSRAWFLFCFKLPIGVRNVFIFKLHETYKHLADLVKIFLTRYIMTIELFIMFSLFCNEVKIWTSLMMKYKEKLMFFFLSAEKVTDLFRKMLLYFIRNTFRVFSFCNWHVCIHNANYDDLHNFLKSLPVTTLVVEKIFTSMIRQLTDIAKLVFVPYRLFPFRFCLYCQALIVVFLIYRAELWIWFSSYICTMVHFLLFMIPLQRMDRKMWDACDIVRIRRKHHNSNAYDGGFQFPVVLDSAI